MFLLVFHGAQQSGQNDLVFFVCLFVFCFLFVCLLLFFKFTKLSSYSLYNLYYSASWGFKFTSLLAIRRPKYLIPKWFPLALLESIGEYCLFSQYCMCNLLLILQTVTQCCFVSSHSWQNCVGYTGMFILIHNKWANLSVTKWQKVGLWGIIAATFDL